MTYSIMFALAMLGLFAVSSVSADAMAALEELRNMDEKELAQLIAESELAAIVEPRDFSPSKASSSSESLPVVTAHGMGDSCFNAGMKQITAAVGKHLGGVYATCVPTGDNVFSDTINGFLMTMDENVKVFAEKIRADERLKNGFDAIGFSQGNSLIRGYVQKYNDPPVRTVLHVHGTVAGVSAFPQCSPQGNLCKLVAELCGDLAYNALVQGILFQADYFRDPSKVGGSAYKRWSQLAEWNNEGNTFNKTYKILFNRTQRFVLVKALSDEMVYPNAGEWYGTFADATLTKTIPMNETSYYKSDSFGLRSADEANKIFFETTAGGHLQFTMQELFGWIDKYFHF
eukprot:g2730.t1